MKSFYLTYYFLRCNILSEIRNGKAVILKEKLYDIFEGKPAGTLFIPKEGN